MKVVCGRLVHSLSADQPIEVLDDVLIGFQTKKEGGKVSAASKNIYTLKPLLSDSVGPRGVHN